MKQLIPIDDYGMFCDNKDTARVNSLFVAQYFEKEHRHQKVTLRAKASIWWLFILILQESYKEGVREWRKSY